MALTGSNFQAFRGNDSTDVRLCDRFTRFVGLERRSRSATHFAYRAREALLPLATRCRNNGRPVTLLRLKLDRSVQSDDFGMMPPCAVSWRAKLVSERLDTNSVGSAARNADFEADTARDMVRMMPGRSRSLRGISHDS